MQPPIQDLKAIQEAFPDYTPADIWSALKYPNIIEQAHKIVQKNKYTHNCMEELAGFHLSRMMDDNYQPLTINFNKINPTYKTKLYQNDSQMYSLSAILIRHGYFQDIVHFIQHLSDNQYSAKQIRQILDIPTVRTDMRRHIFDSPQKTSLPIERKAKIHQKMAFDSCVAEIIKKIGFQELIEDIFSDKIVGSIQLDKPYPFESLKNPSLTITDFCFNHHMPQTIIAFLKQTLEQTHNPMALVSLLQGEKTRHYLQEAYQHRIHPQKKLSVAKPVVDYLESVLPTDLFIHVVSQKNMSYQWQNDFDCQPHIQNQSDTKKQPDKSTTSPSKTTESTSKDLVQSHFFDLLQCQPIDR